MPVVIWIQQQILFLFNTSHFNYFLISLRSLHISSYVELFANGFSYVMPFNLSFQLICWSYCSWYMYLSVLWLSIWSSPVDARIFHVFDLALVNCLAYYFVIGEHYYVIGYMFCTFSVTERLLIDSLKVRFGFGCHIMYFLYCTSFSISCPEF